MSKRFLLPLLLLALVLIGASCSSDSGGVVGSTDAVSNAGCEIEQGVSASPDSSVHVTLNEWAVSVDKTSVKAGNVEFDVKNIGSEKHEFVVIHGAKPGELPITDKGIDEEKLPNGASSSGEIGNVKAKTGHCTVTLKLTPGDYTLMCNIVDDMGHVHAKMGMITPFTVS